MARQIKTEEEQFKFFSDCLDKYREAAGRNSEFRVNYRIAGTVVCLSFAGEALLPYLTPALEHLRTGDNTPPDVTIHVWDTLSTGVRMVPPPCVWADFTDRGDIWGFTSKRIKTAFHWSEYSVNVMDMDSNRGVYWVKDPRAFPYWVYSSPFRTMFHWWTEKNGCQLLHAAAFGTDQGAVLLTGKGGVGKSSTALACLGAGMFFAGDDYVIVKKDPEPVVYSLYCTGKLNMPDAEQYPGLKPLVAPPVSPNQEKAVIMLWPHFRDQIQKEMEIKAILTPKVQQQEETTIQPVSFWPVQRAMSFTTMSQLPLVGEKTHHYINSLVSRIPCYNLSLGAVRGRIPGVINRLLHHPESFPAESVNPVVNKKLPLISVIIPAYNSEKFIAQVVDNVMSQNYPALELIIVDDGSTDGTRKAIEELTYDIRYFFQSNEGPASARNRGIRDASGEYIAFLDSDDLWPENNLNLLLNEFNENPELEIVRGHAQLFRNNEDGTREYTGNLGEAFPDYIGAGLYRRHVFAKVGLFDHEMRFGEDADWYNRARELNIMMKRLEAVTLMVRRHGGNMTEGKSMVELNALRVFKKIIDRKRKNE